MITGTYKLTKSENFEEYMKAIGVGMFIIKNSGKNASREFIKKFIFLKGLVMRKMASTATPQTEITNTGDDWTIKTSTTFKTTGMFRSDSNSTQSSEYNIHFLAVEILIDS